MTQTYPTPSRGVQRTSEFFRVRDLPRRAFSQEDLDRLRRDLTAWLKTPQGGMILNEPQAQALFELSHSYGIFGAMRVGAGKTLTTLLAPLVARSERPLLLVPAALVGKTQRDMRVLAEHFRIPNWIRVMSYELLGRVSAAEELERYRPDLIQLDECHKAKNRKAAVTKRILRYMHAHPETRFCAYSGTVTKRSIKDYAHLLALALRERAPVPLTYAQIEEWASALDEKRDGERRLEPGALLDLCTEEEKRTEFGHRLGYRRRLVDTPGVIATEETGVDMPILASFDRVPLPANVEDEVRKMRATWETPNGETFDHALSLYRHVREMALGFFYFWSPPAPRPWLEARKAWFAACRYILANNQRHLDSPLQVANAVDHGHYPDYALYLAAWRVVRDSFEPRTVPAWLSFDVVSHVAGIAREGNLLVWTNQRAFAEELARLSGLPYFGAEGKDQHGRSIEDHPGGSSVILSMHSNRAGRNLQDRWSENYLVDPPPNGEWIEQILGRTHRQGQRAEEVTARFLSTCPEHEDAVQRSMADAHYMRATLGQEQKILLADWTEG